jgi:DNA-binding NtrC family response regulator
VPVNCAALTATLAESQLFGHEKGAFTGAAGRSLGVFRAAEGGMVFLDEVGEMPLDLQPKLLRALEQREVRRVGSTKSSKVDVRIIAATNRNLEDEVRAGRFRQDLFYRLSVVRLHLPALRNRTDDIPLLIQHFLDHGAFNRKPHAPVVRGVAREAVVALQTYPWPGNVRELVNVVERAVSFCDTDLIELSDLPDYIRVAKAPPREPSGQRRAVTAPPSSTTGSSPTVSMDPKAPAPSPPEELLAQGVTFKDAKERWVASFERDYILQLLRRNTGNISHAARAADIDRKYFRKLMKKYDIEAAGVDEPDDAE